MKESIFEGGGGLKIFTRSWQPEGKTLHDLLHDVDKEVVMADVNDWIDARVPVIQTKSVAL